MSVLVVHTLQSLAPRHRGTCHPCPRLYRRRPRLRPRPRSRSRSCRRSRPCSCPRPRCLRCCYQASFGLHRHCRRRHRRYP